MTAQFSHEPRQLPLRYDVARAALEEATRVDDVKEIHDKARALEVYARQAKDATLIEHATEIRLRAERRAGQLLREMRLTGARAGQGGDRRSNSRAAILKLDDLGVTASQSSRWQDLAELPQDEFERRVNDRRREALAAVTISRAEKTLAKKQARDAKERALAQKQRALPDEKYGVIYADPEWRFEPYSRESGMDRAPENHYPTSDVETICARDVAALAADDCVLFLWATAPMLPQALRVMAAWGFEYKTHAIWEKDRQITGYWFRSEHELLLLGVKGKMPAPAMGTQWGSVIPGKVTEHSTKPEEFCRLIEAYFTNLPKIELNRRGPARPGWAAWGNQAE